MKKIRLSEATNEQIKNYILDHPKKFGVSHNVELNDFRRCGVTRYCDIIDVVFSDKMLRDGVEYYPNIVTLLLDPDMKIKVDSPCLFNDTPADGKGLF